MRLEMLWHQYQTRCQFYAEEMAQELCKGYHEAKRLVLATMAATEGVSVVEIVARLGPQISTSARYKSQRTQGEKLVKELMGIGILCVVHNVRRAPLYGLSDFGRRVIASLPPVPEARADARDTVPASAQQQAPRRHPWTTLDPEIEARIARGETISALADEFGIPRSTLQAHRRSRNGQRHSAARTPAN